MTRNHQPTTSARMSTAIGRPKMNRVASVGIYRCDIIAQPEWQGNRKAS